MHEESPTVTTLALHLPNEQPVYWDENETEVEIRERMSRSKSQLMGYFEYYRLHPNDDIKYLYQEFPRYFVWKENKWWRRQKAFALGRLQYCNPLCGERYFLRLLLINVAGSKSFEDLRTVNGHICSTFKQACLERHLIQDDREWIHCFNEAQLFSSGKDTTLSNICIH